MEQKTFSTFNQQLGQSIRIANQKFALLLQALAFLFLLMLAVLLIPALLFVISFLVPHTAAIYLQVAGYFLAILTFLNYNGALGLMVAKISDGGTDPAEIARKSSEQGLTFFYNGLKTGVIVFLGQILMICPCFLVMSNFVFSPFLYVYENLRGNKARARSKELAQGFGWMVLNRTSVFLFLGYIFLALGFWIALSKFVMLGVIALFFFGLYISLVQNIFIRNVYIETKNLQGSVIPQTSSTLKLWTAFSVTAIVLAYISIKAVPVIINQIGIR